MSENRAPGVWGTWLYQSTLFDLANTVLASKFSVKTICLISEGYRTQRAVTGPMSFKKSRRFVGKPCSRGFGAPGCHPSTLIDIVLTALASKCSVKTICLISEGYRTHRAVTGPMSFKKTRRFVGKSCSRDFGAPGFIKALYLTLQTLFWLEGSCRDHMHEFSWPQNPSSCHWSDEFQKITTFCLKTVLPGFGAPGYIRALYLTLQTLFWLVNVP